MRYASMTQAIILSQKPFREYDAKITVYTKDNGKLELIARGIKKNTSKLAGHLEPICLSNIMVIQGRRFDYIGGAVSENCYFNIKNNLDKICVAARAVRLVNQLTKQNEGIGAEIIFNLLQKFLFILNYSSQIINYQLLFHFFILKFIVALGYKPELYNCVQCKNKITLSNNKFDLSKGGLICDMRIASTVALKISDNCIKVLRLGVNGSFEELNKLKIDEKLLLEITNIINNFLKYYAHFA